MHPLPNVDAQSTKTEARNKEKKCARLCQLFGSQTTNEQLIDAYKSYALQLKTDKNGKYV